MRVTLENRVADSMLAAARSQLGRCDVIGYAAARNARILESGLSEFHKTRDGLIRKYGEPDASGNEFSIGPASPNWGALIEELDPFASIEHEVDVFTIPYEEAIGKLTGTEILELDWMFEDK